MYDEQSLIHSVKQGDKEAFAQLYESHFDKIYRYVAFRIGNKTDAEDITQQVFLNALRSFSSYKWKGVPFSSWLFRIAHNLVVDHTRKEKRYNVVCLDESMLSGDSSPSLLAEEKLNIEQMIRATQKLTAAQREVISLRFAGGLSVAEVAKVMGKSEGAIKALQHSAIVNLRKAMLGAE